MNARFVFTSILLLGTAWSVAQEPSENPLLKAIRDSEKTNEVTVTLAPVGEPPAPVQEEAKPEPAPEKPASEPVLVTGKPPEGTDLSQEVQSPAAAPTETAPEEPAPKPQKGLAVRVEKLQAGTGTIDPSKVKLLAPFPAKPLAQPPVGWRLESSENAPPFTREVELSPGKMITLKVRPHLLVPEADGAKVFNISEPGYDASLGYRQNATVGAILSNSIRQLDEDSKELGAAIDNLQQLLVSLPKSEPKQELKPEPKPEIPRKR